MAVVYQARNPQGEAVALKVLFPPPHTAAETLARFEREARTVARLNHPGIVPVLEAGQAGGRAFMAMPLIEGQTLAGRLAQTGRFDEAEAADIAWQVADALYYAHSRGVVHRDIKPSNILLTRDGRALLTDFGVAQALDDPALTSTGYTVGTPAYMSPEQAAGNQPVDGRADLYSLGVVLYQMVTGRLPFQGGTPQMLYGHVYDPPPPPSQIAHISPGMEAVILRALAKEVTHRFQTGAALAQALDALEQRTGLQVPIVPSPVTTPPKSARRPLGRLIALVGLIGIIAGFAFWSLAGAPQPTPTATLSVAVIPATPTPTLLPPSPTPAPVEPTLTPTETPRPTPTPEPIIIEPSPTPPPPTPTETASPTPTPTETTVASLNCAQPIDETFAALIGGELNRQLGCPRAGATVISAAWQPFERGQLLWREDLQFIYTLRSDNTWAANQDTYQDGQPEPPPDPELAPPAAWLLTPVRGFGRVWREENLAVEIGWAVAEEAGFAGAIQVFDSGTVLHNPAENWLAVLFNNGIYQIISQNDVGN